MFSPQPTRLSVSFLLRHNECPVAPFESPIHHPSQSEGVREIDRKDRAADVKALIAFGMFGMPTSIRSQSKQWVEG